eukprot:sb/3476136/
MATWWPFVRRYLSDRLLLHKTRYGHKAVIHTFGTSVPIVIIVTNSVAMATVLLTLKAARRTIRRSRVGYQKALTSGAPSGCAKYNLYYKLEMNVEVAQSCTKPLFPLLNFRWKFVDIFE